MSPQKFSPATTAMGFAEFVVPDPGVPDGDPDEFVESFDPHPLTTTAVTSTKTPSAPRATISQLCYWQ